MNKYFPTKRQKEKWREVRHIGKKRISFVVLVHSTALYGIDAILRSESVNHFAQMSEIEKDWNTEGESIRETSNSMKQSAIT